MISLSNCLAQRQANADALNHAIPERSKLSALDRVNFHYALIGGKLSLWSKIQGDD